MGAILSLTFLLNTRANHLPPKLLSSICYVESKYNAHAIHKDDGGSDSLGICQIKLKTARWLGFNGTKQELMQPGVNIAYAAKYLHHLIGRYNGRVSQAVIAYNRGHAGYLRTTQYQRRVFYEWELQVGYGN